MAYSQAWLEDPSAIRGIFVEVTAYDVVNVQNVTFYLSTVGYITSDGITSYNAVITNAASITESMSVDGGISMSIGDVEIDNTNGTYDSWLDSTKYIWANKPIIVYVGDPSWVSVDLAEVQSDFLKVFDGVVIDIDSSGRDVLNIKLADKLQRLNCSITETTLGTYGNWSSDQQAESAKSTVIPLVFGEVFNISPVLIDPSQLEYSFGQGPSEKLIELRDNGVPVYSTKENLFTYSEDFSNASWSKSSCAVGATSIMSPDGISTAEKLISNSVATSHYMYKQPVVTSGVFYIWSVYAKAAERYEIGLWSSATGAGFSTTGSAKFNLNTGTISADSNVVATISNVGDGWYRCSIGRYANTTNTATLGYTDTPNATGYVAVTAGDSVSGVYIWGAQLNTDTQVLPYIKTLGSPYSLLSEGATVDLVNSTFKLSKPLVGTLTASVQGTTSNVLIPNGTTATANSVYSNKIINTVANIITNYGVNQLPLSDLDTSNLYNVALNNNNSVGIYIQERGNILQICQDLLDGIGAQMYSNRLGKIQVLQIGVPTSDALVYITESDTLLGTLYISAKFPVLASYKLGYCKNWTSQPSLLTNIPAEHKSMMSDVWYASTVTAPTTANTYTLSIVPIQKDTYLISKADADIQATRMLSYSLVPRYVYRMTCTAKMLSLKLGQQVNLSNRRFGLSSGKLGQVISLSPNWLSGTIDVEVLI